MAPRTIVTVGHLPPPVTGENLCRARLEEVLRARGVAVEARPRRLGLLLAPLAGAGCVIVNGQSAAGSAFDALLAARCLLAGQPVWLYFHNRAWRRYARWPLPAALRRLGRGRLTALVLTDEIRSALAAAGFDATILNNSGGADFDTLAQAPIAPPAKRLLWMGRPDTVKGFPIAEQAFRRLRAQDPSWRFDVYGGTARPSADEVHHHGFVGGAEKLAAFAPGGVFILPSSYANETQPLAIIEALAAGIPVVASDAGGIPRMLARGDDQAGLVVDGPGTPEAYAAAVLTCFADHARHAAAARRIYAACYSHRAFAARVADLFDLD